MSVVSQVRALLAQPAVRRPLIIFFAARGFLLIWAVIVLALNPLPVEPDETLRPYLGEFPLTEGVTGLVLGPWQRFDTLRYLRIARQGYTIEDSVFPPLYSLATRALGYILTRGPWPAGDNPQAVSVGYLLGGLIISNLAFLGSLILLYRIAEAEMDDASATRTVVYLVLFPTAFFLMGAYTEPLFLFLVLGSLWAARRGHPWLAGILGALAALTRLAGWILVVPLSFEYLRQRDFDWRRLDWGGFALLLPLLSLASFLGWRWWVGLPPVGQVFADYWLYRTAWPGADLVAAAWFIMSGQATLVLVFNAVCAGLLIITTPLVWRRFPTTYGLYMISLLLVTLMTYVELRPLNSLSRYTLAFFPAFMVLGGLGRRPWINRLVLYPSLVLYLYFSGQFFLWGWVA